MTRIYDLTEEELVALTDDQIKKYIDYECALEGAPMLPPEPGPKPICSSAKPDLQIYKVAGVIVTNADEAAKILDAIVSCQLYAEEHGKDYRQTYLSSINPFDYRYPKITPSMVFSPGLWDSIKDEQSQIVVKLSEWEKVNDEYTKIVNARQKITDSVWATVEDARDRARTKERLRNDFAQYLLLAENNRSIALAFLEKIKDLSDFPELRKEFCEEEAA